MRNGAARAVSWLAFGGFLCLYAFTAQRGVSWQDSGIYQLRIAYSDLAGYFGAATAHPLYIRAANVFAAFLEWGWGIEVPVAANLFSSLCMALSVRVLFSVALEVSGSLRGSFLAALTFGFSHMAWWLGTVAESYPMSVLLIGLEASWAIRTLKRGTTDWNVFATAALSGMGFATHNLSLLSLPVTLWAMAVAGCGDGDAASRHNSRRLLGVIPAMFLFTVVWLVFSGLPRRLIAAGSPPHLAILDILFGDYASEVVGVSGVPIKVTIANFAIMAFSFLLPCWPVAAAALLRRIRGGGFVSLARRAPASMRLVAALLFIHAVFLLRYRIADQALFMLPTLFFASVALAFLLKDVRLTALLAVATAACAVVVPLAANAVLHLPPQGSRVAASRARTLPYRDEIRYWVLPWKHDERSAEQFASAAVAKMDAMPGAMLYADSTSAPPVALRCGGASTAWSLYTPFNDNSRFVMGVKEGRTAFAVSPVRGYCPGEALSSGGVRPLFLKSDLAESASSPLPRAPE